MNSLHPLECVLFLNFLFAFSSSYFVSFVRLLHLVVWTVFVFLFSCCFGRFHLPLIHISHEHVSEQNSFQILFCHRWFELLITHSQIVALPLVFTAHSLAHYLRFFRSLFVCFGFYRKLCASNSVKQYAEFEYVQMQINYIKRRWWDTTDKLNSRTQNSDNKTHPIHKTKQNQKKKEEYAEKSASVGKNRNWRRSH